MRIKWLLGCLAAVLLPAQGLCQTGAYPLVAPQSSTRTGQWLTASAHAGEEITGAGAVRWNAGVIDGGREKPLEHTFTLQNATSSPVTVSRLHGSCGCETLFLTKGGKEAPTATLAPGEDVKVRVSVALHPGQSGEMHKFAWAYGPDSAAPALASMEIVLTVRPAIAYNPDVLDFGALRVGETRTMDVMVTADADTLAGKPLPTPVGSDASISVMPDGPETSGLRDGKSVRSRRFQVRLSTPAEAGDVSGSIALPPSAPPSMSAVSMPLAGTISGTLTAQPRSVFFGSVPAGQGVTREVMLSEAAAQRGKALSAKSGSVWLTAQVREVAGTNPVLELSLKPGAPVGVIQTQVVVESASGERLNVPVVGEVVGRGP